MKRTGLSTSKKPDLRSPVAKAMHRLTKCATHKDKKNDYQRTPKHRKISTPEQ